MTVDSDSHDISSPNSSLGFEIVLGLGLGTGLVLGQRVGWVLCITGRSYLNFIRSGGGFGK